MAPSGEKATPKMLWECPWSTRGSVPKAMSHRRTVSPKSPRPGWHHRARRPRSRRLQHALGARGARRPWPRPTGARWSPQSPRQPGWHRWARRPRSGRFGNVLGALGAAVPVATSHRRTVDPRSPRPDRGTIGREGHAPDAFSMPLRARGARVPARRPIGARWSLRSLRPRWRRCGEGHAQDTLSSALWSTRRWCPRRRPTDARWRPRSPRPGWHHRARRPHSGRLSECPWSTRRCVPEETSHRRTVESSELEARVAPSGEKSTLKTRRDVPGARGAQCPRRCPTDARWRHRSSRPEWHHRGRRPRSRRLAVCPWSTRRCAPEETSHRRTVESNRARGQGGTIGREGHAQDALGMSLEHLALGARGGTSHRRTVASSEPEATWQPSGEKATLPTR